MKSIALCFLSLFMLFGSCTTPQKDAKTKDISNSNQSTIKIIANTSVKLQVKGMVCKMACGGSLRKELIASGGVEKVEINFIEDKEEQEIIVYYDKSILKVSEILAIIHQTNDGQFTAIAETPSELN